MGRPAGHDGEKIKGNGRKKRFFFVGYSEAILPGGVFRATHV
jgi:hypothetical protein